MWKLGLCFSLGAFLGCSDDHACTDMDCGGTFVVALVDGAGLPAAGRGEIKEGHSITAFEGNGGFVSVSSVISPTGAAEIRFDLQGGSFTPWQPLLVAYERHTDPDFNGPGCSCTWYNARARAVVPDAASLALTDAGAPDAGR
jgi:hypothetical protein